MVRTTNVALSVINQELFSQDYLRELLCKEEVSIDDLAAYCQTLREWREEYSSLEKHTFIRQYVRKCFSSLGVFASSNGDTFPLYVDERQSSPAGICLIVDDTDLGRTVKGAHHQAKLIQMLHSASLHWGVITNGRCWRLCYTQVTAPYEVFLEMDLDVLLDEQPSLCFTLFYQFFGYPAFAPTPSSYNGISFIGLDYHKKEAEKRVEAFQRYLGSRIETILSSLCLGFVHDRMNEVYTREILNDIYQNAVYLLYRILFLFYAEAHHLLPTENASYQQISLVTVVEDARQQQQEGIRNGNPFAFWERLAQLCQIVDVGQASVDVHPYNSGLFSNEEKPFFKKHRLRNEYLAKALFELSYMRDKKGLQRIDYSDLTVRHLGTLYEDLLEYQLHLVEGERVVVREKSGKKVYIPLSQAGTPKRKETTLEIGEAYFTDDKGESKSTGSYYTPEDVVQYIVMNTVLSKLQECRALLERSLIVLNRKRSTALTEDDRLHIERDADNKTLEMIQQHILSLRILDPAMGSAHFLVAAGQVMTNFIIETLNMTEWSKPID